MISDRGWLRFLSSRTSTGDLLHYFRGHDDAISECRRVYRPDAESPETLVPGVTTEIRACRRCDLLRQREEVVSE